MTYNFQKQYFQKELYTHRYIRFSNWLIDIHLKFNFQWRKEKKG